MDSLTSSFSAQQQLELLQFLDIGLIVIDTTLEIKIWNSFMINHTAIDKEEALDKNLFDLIPSLPEDYLRRKFDSVIALQNTLTITWQQRPYLFKMDNYRPITSAAEHMYQNVRIMPLINANTVVDHIAIVIYDVTESARAQLTFKQQNEQLTLSSRIDPLTQVFNRGYWEHRLQTEFKRFSRVKTKSVLVMLDIDFFKKVNDTYGHQAGDNVLRFMGDLLKQQYRVTDIIGRYGGEEFGILLLDTTTERAEVLVEKLRLEIENSIIRHEKSEIKITLSFGLTQISDQFKSHEQWIDLADKALYLSKQNGRNRATVLNDSDIEET